jgi:dihydropyrimidine dehydrogenase (NAD+) subunit PreT
MIFCQRDAMADQRDIASGRLDAASYAAGLQTDSKPPLDRGRALIEASRCYFCFDAPCVEACPTGIDIPSFIRKISTDNVRGAALDILEPNIFGGACARVCPVEELCEEACVRETQQHKPVTIGLLQRYATDRFFETGEQPFTRAPASGKRVAVVGAGPAGLACAHRLSRLGHDVTVYEAKPKSGGLNEFGIAAYKVVDDFAQKEVAFILGLGGITVEHGKALGKEVTLDGLRKDFDAVFLAVGQAGVRAAGVDGEQIDGVEPAVDFIARLRQAPDLAALPVGRRVVVIGGGNTAIDAAVQAKRLGAEDVTLVYRRGPDEMSATGHEQEFAQVSGVRVKHWAQPSRFIGNNSALTGVEFEYTESKGGRLVGTGKTFVVPADMALTAVGQQLVADPVNAGARESLALNGGRIAVDDDGRTSLKGVYAGGDCVAGLDLTVQAVQHGKIAALAIDADLRR